MRALSFFSSGRAARRTTAVLILVLAAGTGRPAFEATISPGIDTPAAVHDLSALRDRLLEHVLRDRPAEATLLGLALDDLARRAEKGDDATRRALDSLEAGRIADALANIEGSAARLSGDAAAHASDLWLTAGLIRGRADWASANDDYEHALALAPGDPDALYGHAKALIALGRRAEARSELARLIATTLKEPSFFYQYWGRLHLARLDIDDGRLGEAEVGLGDLDRRLRLFVAERPNALDWQRDLAVAWHLLGEADSVKGEAVAAVAAHDSGLRIDERLAATDPTSGQWLRDLAYGQKVSADAMLARGDAAGALTTYEKSLANDMRGIASQPDVPVWRKDAAAVAEQIADLLVAKGEFERSRTLLSQAIDVATWQGRVLKERDGSWHRDAARREAKLAALYDDKLHDLPNAIFWYDALRSLNAWLVRVDPQDRLRRRDLAAAFRKLGDAQARHGEGQAASQSFSHALGLDEALIADDPTDLLAQADLAALYEMYGDLAVGAHDTPRALGIFKLDVTTRAILAKAAPTDAGAQRAAALASEKLGDAQSAAGDRAAALRSYREAAAIYEVILAKAPHDARAQRDLAVAANEVGCAELAGGDKIAALADFRRRQQLMDALADAAPDDLDKQHERLLSAFQLNAALTDLGRRQDTLLLLHATRDEAAGLLSRRPHDDVSAKTLAWVEEEITKQGRVEQAPAEPTLATRDPR